MWLAAEGDLGREEVQRPPALATEAKTLVARTRELAGRTTDVVERSLG